MGFDGEGGGEVGGFGIVGGRADARPPINTLITQYPVSVLKLLDFIIQISYSFVKYVNSNNFI